MTAGRRILCLWLPRFSTDRLTRSWPDHAGQPLVLTTGIGGALMLAHVNAVAEEAGLRPGMPLADARALEPGLHVEPHAAEADARALAALADWAGRYSPFVAREGEAGLWIDITGAAHLFGGEAGLLRDLRDRLDRAGHASRAAIADTPGAAWAMAHHGCLRAIADAIVPPGEQAGRLDGLSVRGLRIAAALVQDLRQLGLKTIGDIARLPRNALADRFDESLLRRLDQALGRIFEPIAPQGERPEFGDRLVFAEPIGLLADVEAALDRLLPSVCGALERAGQGARRVVMEGYRVDHRVERVTIGTGRPVRHPEHLRALFRQKLDRLEAGFGFEVIAVRAVETQPLDPRQDGLTGVGGSSWQRAITEAGAVEIDTPALAELVDRLSQRLGSTRVARLWPRASYQPERATAALPPLATAPPRVEWPVRDRPARLFREPQPIEAMAPVPDDPPLRIVWRGRTWRVVRAEGPERIEAEWWTDTGPMTARDYYRLELEGGVRVWVFRQGLYRDGDGVRWFLHGLFG